jgi:hypothetical protein
MWGHYVGLSNPNIKAENSKSPFEYGSVLNIKTKQCENEE